MATCGPVLISFIAGTKKSPSGAIWGWLVFSITRLIIYIFLGSIAGLAGSSLFQRFYWMAPGYIIWVIAGLFITFLGLLIILGKNTHFKICQMLNESLIQHNTKSYITLGVLIGIFPCVPLVGILSYITMISTNISHGIFMSATFGLGTIISPLVLLSIAAGTIPRLRILQDERNLAIFQKMCGVILFILGLHIIVRTILGYIGSA